jgi:hypothetical protein
MAAALFRSGLLEGQVIVLAAGSGAHGEAAARTCAELGDATTPDEVGGVVAYLASQVGDYFSGCVLSLGEEIPA